WQRDCGIKPPSDPLVLALEKDCKAANKGKLKHYYPSCSIGQKCTKSNKVYHTTAQEQDLTNLFKPPPKRQKENESSEGTPPKTPTPPSNPISSKTEKQ
ncbi:hypothetical protein Nmel_000525, partial [Mimus melanotis]